MGSKSINVLVVGIGDIGYSFCKSISEYNYYFSDKCDADLNNLNDSEKKEKQSVVKNFREKFDPIKGFAIDNIPSKSKDKDYNLKPWYTSLNGEHPYCMMNLFSEDVDSIFHNSHFSGFDPSKNGRIVTKKIEDVIPEEYFVNSKIPKNSIDYIMSCFDIIIITVGQDVNSLDLLSRLFKWGSQKPQKVFVRVQDEERKIGVENYYTGFRKSQKEKGKEFSNIDESKLSEQQKLEKDRCLSWEEDIREIITFNPEQDIAYSESIHFTNPSVEDFLRIADYDRLEKEYFWKIPDDSYYNKFQKKIINTNRKINEIYSAKKNGVFQNVNFYLSNENIDDLKKSSLQLSNDNHRRANDPLLFRHTGVAKITIKKDLLTKKKVKVIKNMVNMSLKNKENKSGDFSFIEKASYGHKKKHLNLIGYCSQKDEVRQLYEDTDVVFINVGTNGKEFSNMLDSFIANKDAALKKEINKEDKLKDYITLYVRGKLKSIIKISKKLDSSYKSDLFIINLSKFGKSLSLYSNYLNKGEHVTVISKDAPEVKDVCDAGINIAFIKDATRFADLKELDLKRLSNSRAMLCYGQNSKDAITAALNLYALGIKDITIRGDIKNDLIERIVEGLKLNSEEEPKTLDKKTMSLKVLSLAKKESSKLLPHIISDRIIEYMPFDDDNKIQITEHGIAKICSYQRIFDELIEKRFKSVVHKLFDDTNVALSAHWCYGSLYHLLEFAKAIEAEEQNLKEPSEKRAEENKDISGENKKKNKTRPEVSIQLLSQDRCGIKECSFERSKNGATLIFVYSNKLKSFNKKENEILDHFVRRFQNLSTNWEVGKIKADFMMNSVYEFDKNFKNDNYFGTNKKRNVYFVDCSDGYYEQLFSKSSDIKISKRFKSLLKKRNAYIYMRGINYYDGRFDKEMETLLTHKDTKCTFIIYSTNEIVLEQKSLLETYSFLKHFNKVELADLKSTVIGVERQVIVKKPISHSEEIYITDFNSTKSPVNAKFKKQIVKIKDKKNADNN